MTRFAALLLVFASAACPWRGVNDLIADASVEIVVTGLESGDQLELTIDGDTTRLRADGDGSGRVTLYEQLTVGNHDGELLHQRGDDERCAAFSFVTREGERTSVAFDVATLDDCDDDDDDDDDAGPDPEEDAGPDPDDDGGLQSPHLERLREVARDETCTPEPCEVEVRLEEGRVELRDDSGDLEGELPEALWDDIVALALSAPADALFLGEDPSCPVPLPPTDVSVELERRVELDEDETTRVTERLDVTDCDGVAAQLRALIDDARQYATEASEDPPDDGGP